MVLSALAYYTLAFPLTTASLMLAAVLLGSGASLLYPTLAALVVDRAAETERGLALGTLSAAWDLGVVVGSALIGFIADSRIVRGRLHRRGNDDRTRGARLSREGPFRGPSLSVG